MIKKPKTYKALSGANKRLVELFKKSPSKPLFVKIRLLKTQKVLKW